jgi:GNAT superfamily N-acetyltransferase
LRGPALTLAQDHVAIASDVIRPGRDEDAAGFISLIERCWADYPGIVFDVDAEMPELRALATYYAGKGGVLCAAECNDAIAGMIATIPLGDGVWEICRVYTLPSAHGGGLGHRLLDQAETHARRQGATRFALWSDTRFDRAHRFYEKRGYIRHGPIRALHDLSHSLEFSYVKPVDGIECLDAAAAASAERGLAEILCACVDDGASASFLPPLAPEVARSFWKRVTADVAANQRILLAAWSDAQLVGIAMLALSPQQNQPHCAEVQTLLVHPDARRRGIARSLMLRLEREAHRAGRTLLTVQLRADDAGESLYRSLGWQEVGRIPRHVLKADGTLCDTVIFWRI